MDWQAKINQYWKDVGGQVADGIRSHFASDAVIRWHNTNEQFSAEEFVRVNCDYPGAWASEVERLECCGEMVISVARIYQRADPNISFHATSFFKIKSDLISELDEYWGDDMKKPRWRAAMNLGKPIK